MEKTAGHIPYNTAYARPPSSFPLTPQFGPAEHYSNFYYSVSNDQEQPTFGSQFGYLTPQQALYYAYAQLYAEQATQQPELNSFYLPQCHEQDNFAELPANCMHVNACYYMWSRGTQSEHDPVQIGQYYRAFCILVG